MSHFPSVPSPLPACLSSLLNSPFFRPTLLGRPQVQAELTDVGSFLLRPERQTSGFLTKSTSPPHLATSSKCISATEATARGNSVAFVGSRNDASSIVLGDCSDALRALDDGWTILVVGGLALSHHDQLHGVGHVLVRVSWANEAGGDLSYVVGSPGAGGARARSIPDLLRALDFPSRCSCGWRGNEVGTVPRTPQRAARQHVLLPDPDVRFEPDWTGRDAVTALRHSYLGDYVVRPSSKGGPVLTVTYKEDPAGTLAHTNLFWDEATRCWHTEGRVKQSPSLRSLLVDLGYGLRVEPPLPAGWRATREPDHPYRTQYWPPDGTIPVHTRPTAAGARPGDDEYLQLHLQSLARAVARVTFTGTPNSTELSFDKGDVLHILERDDDDGWWRAATDTGRVGFVPATAVQVTEEGIYDFVATAAPSDMDLVSDAASSVAGGSTGALSDIYLSMPSPNRLPPQLANPSSPRPNKPPRPVATVSTMDAATHYGSPPRR